MAGIQNNLTSSGMVDMMGQWVEADANTTGDKVLVDDEDHSEPLPSVCPYTLFFFIIYGPLYGVVCGCGIVGNTLSFAVLHKYSKTVATYLLKALAVMDNIFLTVAASVQMSQGLMLHFGLKDQLEPHHHYYSVLLWPLVHMSQTGTVWIMVLVAANRFIAVCKPLHASRLCTKRNIRIQLLVLALAIIIYNTPRFFEYRLVNRNVTTENGTAVLIEQNEGIAELYLYNILYENVAYCLFVVLIPLVVLVFFNVHLVHSLKKAQQNRRALHSRGNVEENNITLVMVVIIIVFIACQTPAAINQILYYLLDDSYKESCTKYMHYFHLCNLIILINSSVNFIIYCVLRRQFQQELVALLCRCSPSTRQAPLRKTVLLRAMHMQNRGSSLRDTTYSMYLRETSSSNENQPLKCEDNIGGHDNSQRIKVPRQYMNGNSRRHHRKK